MLRRHHRIAPRGPNLVDRPKRVLPRFLAEVAGQIVELVDGLAVGFGHDKALGDGLLFFLGESLDHDLAVDRNWTERREPEHCKPEHREPKRNKTAIPKVALGRLSAR